MDHLAAWRRFAKLRYSDLPRDVQTIAKHCVMDWFACALAGSSEPLAGLLRDEFGQRAGPCTLIGAQQTTDAATAALLNGAAGHALDFDDTNFAIGCHGTAPVLPAVLAAAEQIGADGRRLLAAFVVGVEVEGRIGNAIGPQHYANGWHSTATYGVFGAAAGVAHLLGLAPEQYGCAMGLAASQASGLKANFGTMAKPFHAGHAAERGLLSARLAARGFTANANAFAANQGLVQAAGNGSADQAKLKEIADAWLIKGTLFKHHAACHLTHAAIEGAKRLRAKVAADDLAKVTLTVHPALLDVCGIAAPKTGLEAKFSLAGATAMAFLGLDTGDKRTFVDEVAGSAPVQALLPKIQVQTDNRLQRTQTLVKCVDKAQTTFEHFHDTGAPAWDLVEQGERLRRKFDNLCADALGPRTAARRASLESLPMLDDLRCLRSA